MLILTRRGCKGRTPPILSRIPAALSFGAKFPIFIWHDGATPETTSAGRHLFAWHQLYGYRCNRCSYRIPRVLQMRAPKMRLSRLSLAAWPRTLHRKLYYRLIMFLERRIYRNPRVRLAAVSQHLANKLQIHFQRTDVVVITNAVDTKSFSRLFGLLRVGRSKSFGFAETDFVLLLIGMIGRTRVWTDSPGEGPTPRDPIPFVGCWQ